jgi:GTPase KRas protein
MRVKDDDWLGGKPPIIIIGTKCDRQDERQITFEEGAEFAKSKNMTFFETSARNKINVEETFICAAREFRVGIYSDKYVIIILLS